MNIYLLDITSIPEQGVSDYASALDADRQARIAEYKRSADKRRSFGAGMALLYAWRQQYQERIMPPVMRDGNGKPGFIGADIPFCLSHSGNYAACVLGEEAERAVGLDIQEPCRIRNGLAERFFSEGENEQLRAGGDPCLIWSRKESLAKYIGNGLRGDLRLLDTAGEPVSRSNGQSVDNEPDWQSCEPAGNVVGRRLCQTADHMPHPWSCQTADGRAHIWSCQTFDGYAVSVCTEKAVECCPMYLTWEQVKGILER